MSDKIERIIDALRKKILEEAIRGNLVPQNPEDEPASVLLQRIEAERERLIKEKKIKRPKSVSKIFRRDGHFYESINGGEPTCIDDDIPFEIPDSWEWVRLESICQLINADKKSGQELPVLDAHFLRGKKEGTKTSSGRYICKGDWLILVDGENSGEVFEAPCDGYAGSTFKVLWKTQELNCHYFLTFLEIMREHLRNNKIGGAIPHLNKRIFYSLLLPLPSQYEQQRIIKRSSNLIDNIDSITQVRASIKRIISETPTSLRPQLIQAAIQGKLVPQDPSDEPASELLKRIAEERTAKQGKKAAKSMSRIERRGSKTYELFPDGTEKDISDEIPFDIPEHWQWCRLDMAGTYRKGPFGSSLTKNHFVNKTTGCIKVYEQKNAIQKNHELGNYYISPTYYEQAMQAFDVGPSDIIVSCAGTIGEAYKLPSNAKKGIINQALMRIRLSIHINDSYFLRYFDYIIKMQAKESGKGSVIKNIPPFAVFKQLLMPVPPIQEQHRIVEKLSALLRLV